MTSPEPEATQPPVDQPSAETTAPVFPPSMPTQPAYSAPPAPVQPPAVQPPAVQPTAAYPPVQPAQPAYPQTAYPQTAAQPAYQGQPAVPSAPPSSYPTSSVPGQPVTSAVPYPTSAYPATGMPLMTETAPKKKGPAVLILSIVVGLLVVALGAVTTLYVVKANDATKKEKAAATQAAADAKTVADLKAQVETVKAEAEKAKQDAEGARNANAEKIKLLNACVDAVKKMMAATSETAVRKALTDVVVTCQAADIATN
jgi:hypothetical protein